MTQEHIYNLQLQIGEYFIPEGCTIKRVGKTIHVYKKQSNKLPPSEKRCRDCKFFGKGHTVYLYHLANVCLKKPKQKEGFSSQPFLRIKYAKSLNLKTNRTMTRELTEEQKKELKSIEEMVLKEWDKGNVVYADFEGLKAIKFEDFIKQPLDGMLYDINRNLATILTFIEDPKWVNDFALTKLLEYYYNKCKEYEKEKK